MAEKMSIMVVDDEMIVRESLRQWFKKFGHSVETASSGQEALDLMERVSFDVLFVDLKMPGMGGVQLLKEVKASYPDAIVVIITAYGSIETAVEALKSGAADYMLKPFKPEQLSLVLEKISNQRRINSEYRYMKRRLEEKTRFDNIIGQSKSMQAVFDILPEISGSDTSVLIVGETGTGKELFAKAIHAKSKRCSGPFVAINCGAIPDTLLEGELFGYKKGAFTGANTPRKGYVEVAEGGTLFLDEIGEVSSKMQIDLLRVLQEKRVNRIGEREPIDVDFRLISATRRNLEEDVAAGAFREDLYYRVNVIRIEVPPLRERREDIPLLAGHFLERFTQEMNKQVDSLSEEALESLVRYDWPGNVRELENAMERAVVLARSQGLERSDFDFLFPQGRPKGRSLRDQEKAYVREVLSECGWNITRAAKILEINRVTLHKMIKRHNLRKTG